MRHLSFISERNPKNSSIMSLYPSLEDMQVDKLIQHQQNILNNMTPPTSSAPPPAYTQNPYPEMNQISAASSIAAVPNKSYPDLTDFMGLELTQQMIAENMPEYLKSNQNQSVS